MVDEQKITLVAYTPHPDKMCTAAARLSLSDGSATEVYDMVNPENPGNTLGRVMRLGHRSVSEHANFTFAFENVPIFFEQFLIEHRLAAYTVKSRRYVDFRESKTAIPPSLTGKAREGFINRVDGLFDSYSKLVDSGIPAEDARFILPYGMYSHLFATMNGREWMHFIAAAIEGRGSKYKAIKAIGEEVWQQLKEVAPKIFERYDALENRPTVPRDKILEIAEKLKLKTEKSEGIGVQLLDYTPEPELTLARVALIGNSGANTEQVVIALKDNRKYVYELCRHIVGTGRSRELEQLNFTFRLDGVSLPTLTHIARHRMQSLLVPDLVDMPTFKGFTRPATIMNNDETRNLFINTLRNHRKYYKDFLQDVLPPEERIYGILCGRTMSVVTTMHARQLIHFFRLRTCLRAQWEIRALAEEMLVQSRQVALNIFANAGPGCVQFGYCPEGPLTCGKMDEVRKRYGANGEIGKRNLDRKIKTEEDKTTEVI